MAEILFGQAYYLRFDPKLWRAQQPYPPLGTLYAAACLREAGYDVALFDAMLADSVSEWEAALDRHAPRFAVIYEDSFNYLSKMCLLRMREAALAMTRAARRRGATVIVSGSDATDHGSLYLDAGASFVVVGEGEITLRELVDALGSGGADAAERVAGLALRGADGGLRRTPARPFIKDLDGLPLPAWDLVDVTRYRRIWRSRHGYHSMNAVTTRGCPYHCNWCAKPIYGQRYAVRSPENVAAELRFLRARYAPDHVSFVDDIFGLRPGWLEAFAEAVRRQDAVTPFKCLTRADLLDARSVRALASAGCRTVWIGAESGSQKILDAMEKGTRVGQIREAARLLRSAGIEVCFFLQFGYPGETQDDVSRTIELIRECRPDDIGISVAYPLPGTVFYERVRAQLGDKRNWNDSDDLAMLYRGPFTTDYYRTLHRVVHQEFRITRLRDEIAGGGRRRSRRRGWRGVAELAYYAASLPLARSRLRRLATRNAGAVAALPVALAPEAAARPSLQEWEAPPRTAVRDGS
jgi:radical SAM superfamily enzyme YgiQ (UPF0313 family)